MAKEFVDTTAETVEETVVEDIPVSSLITVKQLPIIEEHLEALRDEISAIVAEALALPVTEDTVKEIKKKRAELKKKWDELEGMRKDVKKKVVQPYNAFDKVFKSCVTDIFQSGDDELKARIDEVENARKAEKEEAVKVFFVEYAASLHLPDYVTFERMGLNVLLSTTETAYKKQAKEFLDKVSTDLQLIETHPNADEVLVEYKKTLDAPRAILEVNNRHKQIEDERQRADAARRQREEEAKAVEQVEVAYEEESAAQAPTEVPTAAPTPDPVEEPTIYKGTFTLIGTKEQIKNIINYIKEKGVEIQYHGSFTKYTGSSEA